MDKDNARFSVAFALISVPGSRLTLDLAHVKTVYPICVSAGFTFSLSVLAYMESILARSKSISSLIYWIMAISEPLGKDSILTYVNGRFGENATARDCHDLESASKPSHPAIKLLKWISSSLGSPVFGAA